VRRTFSFDFHAASVRLARVRSFLIGILGATLAAGTVAAATNTFALTNRVIVSTPGTNDAVEEEYHKLLEDDNVAQAEVDRWIRENSAFADQGAGVSPAELRHRIRARFEPIEKDYVDFLKRHPDHVKARIAYASFLGDVKDEDAAREQLEIALKYETNDPAIYNNLANIYGHSGPVKQAFEFYAKAISLDPTEAVYYQNFGTTVYLFRKDAMEYYGISEQEVFNKALELYSKATKMAPDDFPLATDVAMTYYGIQPRRTHDALQAWTNALSIAHDEIEREGVYIHFARIKLQAGRLAEARDHLNAVTNSMYADLKRRITRNVDDAEKKLTRTNAPGTVVAP